MFESHEKLKEEIRRVEPSTFVSKYLFEPVPYSFAGNLDSWIEWKHGLASRIGVDPKDIVCTGSSALGFSLNPHKNFKAFDDGSDIDCGVVSQYYFDLSWRHLRQEQVSLDAKARSVLDAIREHKKYYIFEGTIAADRILSILPFGKQWQDALDEMRNLPATAGRDVKIRIYKDYDSLRFYQARNLKKLRDSIIEGFDMQSTDIDASAIEVEE